MIIELLVAFLAVWLFSVSQEVPKRLQWYAGLSGAFGWLIYLLMDRCTDSRVGIVFVSAIGVALLSHLLARLLKAPASIFLIAGILPSVPGGPIYRSVYFLMSDDPAKSNYYLIETLQIAGAIAIAIFIVDSLMKLFLKNKGK